MISPRRWRTRKRSTPSGSRTAAPKPVLPALLPMVTGRLVAEVFAQTLAIAPPRLAAGVLTLDASGAEELHPVLPRPDCPACSTKGRRPRPAEGEADMIVQRAVDPLCGVVRRVELMPKAPTEPERPFIVRAELANSHFRTGVNAFVVVLRQGVDSSAGSRQRGRRSPGAVRRNDLATRAQDQFDVRRIGPARAASAGPGAVRRPSVRRRAVPAVAAGDRAGVGAGTTRW